MDIRDLTLENNLLAEPRDTGLLFILAALEHQLEALDLAGAHIAAAHVDAAIQQLRLDLTRQ
jgi:hypothetical protein